MTTLKKLTSFDEHLDKQYGKKGNPKREKYEDESLKFRLKVQHSTFATIIEIAGEKNA